MRPQAARLKSCPTFDISIVIDISMVIVLDIPDVLLFPSVRVLSCSSVSCLGSVPVKGAEGLGSIDRASTHYCTDDGWL